MRNMSTVVPGNFFELVPGSGATQQRGARAIVGRNRRRRRRPRSRRVRRAPHRSGRPGDQAPRVTRDVRRRRRAARTACRSRSISTRLHDHALRSGSRRACQRRTRHYACVATTDEIRPGAGVDPALAEVIEALSSGGFWGKALDSEWRTVALTDELAAVHAPDVVFGAFMFGPEQIDQLLRGSSGGNSLEENRQSLRQVGAWVLADLQIERDELRERVHPALRDVVGEIKPTDSPAISYEFPTSVFGGEINAVVVQALVRDATGRVVGTVILNKPAVGMTTMAIMTAAGDLNHFNRMVQLGEARRRPVAVMFADIEGSTALSKRLPTASYFTLVRRIMRAADQCVIDAGGLVGRHVGDGVTAFFVAETAGSESAAARGCISAARRVAGFASASR